MRPVLLYNSKLLTRALPFLAFKCQGSQLTKYHFLYAERLHFACMFLYGKCFKRKNFRNFATQYSIRAFLQRSIVKFFNFFGYVCVDTNVNDLPVNFNNADEQTFLNLLTMLMGNIYLHCRLIPHATRVPAGTKKSEGSQSFNRKIKQIMENETRWLSNPVRQKLRRKA